jgi:hypothetical protein
MSDGGPACERAPNPGQAGTGPDGPGPSALVSEAGRVTDSMRRRGHDGWMGLVLGALMVLLFWGALQRDRIHFRASGGARRSPGETRTPVLKNPSKRRDLSGGV